MNKVTSRSVVEVTNDQAHLDAALHIVGNVSPVSCCQFV
jgi:hypothetical protein